MNLLKDFDVKDKKECPYNIKCYRKNPIHFNEMSHPHLEKLLGDCLEGEIEIPDELDFECMNRQQLLDQLKVLQLVLRKERDKSRPVNLGRANGPVSETPAKNKKPERKELNDLKAKIEKHKFETAAKRQKKLLEMDKSQAFVDKCNKKSTQDNREAIDNEEEKDVKACEDLELKNDAIMLVQEVIKDKQDQKRKFDTSNNGWYTIKKSKPENKSLNNVNDTTMKDVAQSSKDTKEESCSQKYKDGHKFEKESTIRSNVAKTSENKNRDNVQSSNERQKTTSSENLDSGEGTSSGTSIIDAFDSCASSKSREEMRRKAIKMMKQRGFDVHVVEPGGFSLKYALSAPYHLFYTCVQDSKETYKQQFSLTFPEILDRSLGEIVSSLQINFMVDVGWLCLQYLLAAQRTDMLIMYGDRVDHDQVGSHIQLKLVVMPSRFGCHHSKIMVLKYKDNGIRIVVSTANLYADDWENRTQAVWISPHLQRLSNYKNPNDGESPTMFKKDFLTYLNKYGEPKLSEWMDAVRWADFSAVNVFFVGSVPGSHKDRDLDSWGHRKVGYVLSNHITLPPNAKDWSIIAQASSIGSLGQSCNNWLLSELVSSMSRTVEKGLRSQPKFQFIYPSLKNYMQSYEAPFGTCCLPYGESLHSKQKWIELYMYQWKSKKIGRDKAMPHIKSYTRVSPDLSEISWFILTSANLSKAAWGNCRNSNYILSYEAGVIFVPKFVLKKDTFPIEGEYAGVPTFPMPYDLPLTRYESGDEPFTSEGLLRVYRK